MRFTTSVLTFRAGLMFLSFSMMCLGESNKEAESYIQKVAEKNLASFGWEEDGWSSDDMSSYLNEVMRHKCKPTAKCLRSNAFSLFKEHESKLPARSTILVDPVLVWSDLTLFCGQQRQDVYLAHALCRTQTELGKVALFSCLSTPIVDVARLRKRQEVIAFLGNNQEVLNRFDTALETIHSAVPVFLSFYQADHFQNTIKNLLTFPVAQGTFLESLNKSPLAFNIKSIAGHAQRLQWCGMAFASAVALTAYGLFKVFQKQPHPQVAALARDAQGGLWSPTRMVWDNNIGWVNASLAFLTSLYAWQQLPSNIQWAKDCYRLEECLHTLTTQGALFMRSARALYDEVKQYPDIANFDEIAHIREFFETKIEALPALKELVELLSLDTFVRPFSLFTNRGHCIRAYNLIHEVKHELQSLAVGIGTVDMYVSLAKLVKEFENKPVHFCFPQYLEADQPTIDLTDFWHPLLDAQNVVSNTLTLGGTYRQNMIITGPNAGGKSTILKTIALCILLGQSLGIAPAMSMSFTPFHAFKTYLNIVDDIGAGNSLFMAEVKQAQRLIDKIESQSPHEFSFICFDEVFNGTSPVEGAAAAYSVAHHLAPIRNNICVIATHFPLLAELEQDTDTFKNYKVSVDYDAQGCLRYPFKLEEGASHQHVALDVLKQQGFAGSLLKKAQTMVEKIRNNDQEAHKGKQLGTEIAYAA